MYIRWAVPAEKKGEEYEEKRFDYADCSDCRRMRGTDKLPVRQEG
jgi:hypothetical protein